MDYKDIEEKLKADAVKQERKNFSFRWNEIQEKIDNEDNSKEREYVYNRVQAPAGVVSVNSAKLKTNKRSPFFITTIVFVVSVLIILAIVLPIILTKKNKVVYFDEEQLTYSFVEKEDFYIGLDKGNIDLIDLSEYEVDGYRLYFANSNSVKGGAFEFSDEELGCFAYVIFYDVSVKVNESSTIDYEVCSVKGSNVNYKIEQLDGYYSLFATTVFNGVYYRMKCTTINDNVFELFNQLLK